MVILMFLLYLSISRGQNEEIRTEDFMNFSNPIDSRENRKAQNIDLFIEQYLNFNEDNLLESDNLADIQVQKKNMAFDSFCEIHCDSSLMNIENIPSTSLYHLKSDQELLYDEIESFLDSTTFEIPNLTIGASVSPIEPGCQCVGLCLCITTPKPDKNPLDIDSACQIDSDIFFSEIVLSNEQNKQDVLENKDISESDPCQIEFKSKADLNSIEQSSEQQTYPDITDNIYSTAQSNHIMSLPNNRYNNKLCEKIEKLYLDQENKMNKESGVQINFEAEGEDIQIAVQPSTSQEMVIPGVKYGKKRKYPKESNEITKRKTVNFDCTVKESFLPGESDEYLNDSENERTVNQAKIIYDPDSQDGKKELDFHLKKCNYYAHLLLKRLIIQIHYENSQVKDVKYFPIESDQNIPKTEKSKNPLYIFGTFINRPSRGGPTFTVRVPKLFEDQAQFKNSVFPLASAFVPMAIFDGYNLSMTMSKNKKKMKLPSASFELNNVIVYVPNRFYAYHFQQVMRFEINRRANNRVFYYFEYWPEKSEELDFNS